MRGVYAWLHRVSRELKLRSPHQIRTHLLQHGSSIQHIYCTPITSFIASQAAIDRRDISNAQPSPISIIICLAVLDRDVLHHHVRA